MVFLEAPHKLCATLDDMVTYFGADRHISLSRELTKLHEETLRMTLGEAVEYFKLTPPRGEFVLCIEGKAPDITPEMSLEDAVAMVSAEREAGTSLKDAAKKVSEQTGFSKKLLYDACVK